MKPKNLEIAELLIKTLNGYNEADRIDGIKTYLEGIREAMLKQGWLLQKEKPEGKEFFKVGDVYYIQDPKIAKIELQKALKTKRAEWEKNPEHKKHVKEQNDTLAKMAKEMKEILPLCKCGKQVALQGICSSCEDGELGYRSKYVCSCGYKEKFKITFEAKMEELRRQ